MRDSCPEGAGGGTGAAQRGDRQGAPKCRAAGAARPGPGGGRGRDRGRGERGGGGGNRGQVRGRSSSCNRQRQGEEGGDEMRDSLPQASCLSGPDSWNRACFWSPSLPAAAGALATRGDGTEAPLDLCPLRSRKLQAATGSQVRDRCRVWNLGGHPNFSFLPFCSSAAGTHHRALPPPTPPGRPGPGRVGSGGTGELEEPAPAPAPPASSFPVRSPAALQKPVLTNVRSTSSKHHPFPRPPGDKGYLQNALGWISGHPFPQEPCAWLDACLSRDGAPTGPWERVPGPCLREVCLGTITSRLRWDYNINGVHRSASFLNFLAGWVSQAYVSLCFSCCCRYCSFCLCMFSCFSHLSTVLQT